jgi:hypothetical protein
VTELRSLDLAPDAAERIRRRARATFAEHADRGPWVRVERAAVRWIETPLVGVFASGLLAWAAAAVFAAPTL